MLVRSRHGIGMSRDFGSTPGTRQVVGKMLAIESNLRGMLVLCRSPTIGWSMRPFAMGWLHVLGIGCICSGSVASVGGRRGSLGMLCSSLGPAHVVSLLAFLRFCSSRAFARILEVMFILRLCSHPRGYVHLAPLLASSRFCSSRGSGSQGGPLVSRMLLVVTTIGFAPSALPGRRCSAERGRQG